MRALLVAVIAVVASMNGCSHPARPQKSVEVAPAVLNSLTKSQPIAVSDLNRDDNGLDIAVRERTLTLLYGPEGRELASKLDTRGLRMYASTTQVEDEVNNGGFNQYFWNSEGKNAGEAEKGY